MGIRTLFARLRSPAFQAFEVVALAGLVLVSLPPLALLSFDAATLLSPNSRRDEVALIYATEGTLEQLGSTQGLLNRSNHARLLDHLTQDGAKLVFYDFAFTAPGPDPEADRALAAAIRRNGRVVLIATEQREQTSLGPNDKFHILPALRTATTNWGHAELFGNFVREISGTYLDTPYAVWLAATSTAPAAMRLSNPDELRWLKYYGHDDHTTFTNHLFHEVLAPGFPVGVFKDQVVFVGQDFAVHNPGGLGDEFLTPYSRFGLPPMPGVAIHATAYLNLVRGDWLRFVPIFVQWLVVLAWAGVIAGGMYQLSLQPWLFQLGIALAGAALCFGLVLMIQLHLHFWWNWLAAVVGQTGIALVWVRLHPKSDRYLAFISYRNEDDGAAALLIQRSLAERGLRVFLDVRSLEVGKFDEQLLHEIEAATFFVVILSPKSLARCVNPDDWVLRELNHALTKAKPIVPVFRGGFNFDAKEGVPDLPQIAELRRFQGVLYTNADFDGFMERLAKLLKRQ